MSAPAHRLPAPTEFLVTEETFALWQSLAAFPADQTEAALRHLQEWLARKIAADNVIWVGAVRVIDGPAARDDPFSGWRLRARRPLQPDSAAYRRLLAGYYAPDHNGKLTPAFHDRSHDERRDAHVGMPGRASLAGAGRFRVHRLRDGWIDFVAFKRTLHYQLYYRDQGIVDRMTIGFPATPDAESFLLIDRQGPRRRPFTAREAALAGGAARGIPELHRRLFLTHGLFTGDRPLSPAAREILHGLLSGLSEKEIAARIGQRPATLHKYVTALYTRHRVKSRAALMAQWLGRTS
ncbi:helix-turn-helix transcriptional regulator [Opitutus terrae]|uniref:Transcriptional regulator, LuxR family n=1 Tax=Opitutus terrae (strain DSM 11246 / JCM 15787 / PB90-1) TaxID=452637 RepID=B1ZVS1_OPITP|nr:LuxR C-terminal-related transcriptional regulator [Opitutus terrae]ACB75007.1 transcriptional regulator, LuxR family [Opitutus terrae PB90-1]